MIRVHMRVIVACVAALAGAAVYGAAGARAQQSVPGCNGGLLTDPRTYFNSLVASWPASNWPAAMNAIDADLQRYRIGQQRSSALEPRGRLFLPHAACPDASGAWSGNANPACWEHAVDVVDGGPPARWVWVDRGGPTYLPAPCGAVSVPQNLRVIR